MKMKRAIHDLAKTVADEWNANGPDAGKKLWDKLTKPMGLKLGEAIMIADCVTAYRTNGEFFPIPEIID